MAQPQFGNSEITQEFQVKRILTHLELDTLPIIISQKGTNLFQVVFKLRTVFAPDPACVDNGFHRPVEVTRLFGRPA